MKSKYALRALIVMTLNERKTLQCKVIAEQADVPAKFLEAILQELKQHGFVASKRGIFGGYMLGKPAAEITVGDIIRVLDGTLAPLRCASVHQYEKCDDCPDESSCVIRRVMMDVRTAIAGVLDNVTLVGLLAMSPKRKQDIFW